MAQEKKRKLSIYLIKESYADDELIVPKSNGMLEYNITDDIGELGALYIKTDYETVPQWADFFAGLFKPDDINLKTKSARAVLILNIKNRKMCITFGHAQHLLEPLSVVKNFGLKVALNLGGETSLRAVDKTSLDLIAIQSKEQSSKDVAIDEFNFDFEMDILKSISVKDSEELNTVSGRDAVSICAAVTLDRLRDFLESVLESYNSDKYKEKFAWVDNICPERDKSVINQLNTTLVERIINKDISVWLAVPEIIKWEDVQGFTFKRGKSQWLSKDIHLTNWIDEIVKESSDIDIQFLKRKKVHLYDVNFNHYRHWSVYQCLNAEIDFNGNKYVLNDSEWYCVNKDFVTDVNASFDALIESDINLPVYNKMNEPEYNKHVYKKNPCSFALMDAKNINMGGGRSKIEFCDLLSLDNKIIHVKKYGGSSVLSHLFQQGVVSGELMLNSAVFREKINEKLSEQFKFDNASERPDPRKYEICFAIMSDIPGDLHIPFFSKVVLKNAVNRLQAFGYTVTKKKICMQ